jgi:pimeloyl-ACP methyl ester carboxylesterase
VSTELFYETRNPAGERTIIALAGGAARHPAYLDGLAGLDRTYRLVVPHLRGVGRTPLAPGDRGSYWRQAEDIEALRQHLGLDRLHLLGHSAGTRLALAHAVRFPGRVAALVLVTPPAAYLVDVPSDQDEIYARRRGEPWFDAAEQAAEEGPATDDDQGLNDWYARVAARGYAVWDDAARAHATVGWISHAAMRAYFSIDATHDLRAGLETITAPVLVVAGAQDSLTGLAPVVALPRQLPRGELAVLEDCGHFPWVEQPAAFRAAVDGFLQRV